MSNNNNNNNNNNITNNNNNNNKNNKKSLNKISETIYENILNNEELNNNNLEKEKNSLFLIFNNLLLQNRNDLSNYIKFIFYDLIQLKKDKIVSSTNNLDTLKNSILDKIKNKLNNYTYSNVQLKKDKTIKLIDKIKNNRKKIIPFYLEVKKKVEELSIKKNSNDIKFNENIDFKLKNNIFEIDTGFKFKIGEFLMRFLFLYTKVTLYNPTLTYNKFIDYNKNFYDIDIDLIKKDNSNYIYFPQFTYFYSYFCLMNDLFEKDLDLTNIFNEKNFITNTKKLFEFYKTSKSKNSKKKDKDKKGKDKKGKDKKGKDKSKVKKYKKLDKKTPIHSILQSGGDNNNNNDNNIKNNNNQSNTNILKDDTFKKKEALLQIMKKTNSNNTNLYKLYNTLYSNLIDNYIEDKIDSTRNNNEGQDMLFLINRNIDHPIVPDDIDSKFKIIKILQNTKKINEKIKIEEKKVSNKKIKGSEWKSLIKENIDYRYKFNILQLLRKSILDKDTYSNCKKFHTELYKNLLFLLNHILKTKLEIYNEILDLSNNNINTDNTNNINNTNKNIVNKKNIQKNNIIVLIDGTRLNTLNYQKEENKIIIKKIRVLIQEYHNLSQKINKNYDSKVLFIQKLLNQLILQLK